MVAHAYNYSIPEPEAGIPQVSSQSTSQTKKNFHFGKEYRKLSVEATISF